MKNPSAVCAGVACGLAILALAVWTNYARADEGNEPSMQVTLCQQVEDSDAAQVLQDCAKAYTSVCPTGYDLGQVIINMAAKPYWVAAELTCKPGTKA